MIFKENKVVPEDLDVSSTTTALIEIRHSSVASNTSRKSREHPSETTVEDSAHSNESSRLQECSHLAMDSSEMSFEECPEDVPKTPKHVSFRDRREGIFTTDPEELAEIKGDQEGIYDPENGSLIITESTFGDFPEDKVALDNVSAEQISAHQQHIQALRSLRASAPPRVNHPSHYSRASVAISEDEITEFGPAEHHPLRLRATTLRPARSSVTESSQQQVQDHRRENGSFATSLTRSQIPRWAKKEHMMAQHQSGETTLLGKLLGRHEDELYAEESYVASMSDGSPSSKHHRRLALDPRSAMRCRWDMVIILSVAWTCFILPMRVGFGDEEIGPMTIADWLIDVVFMIDIIVNFCTGYFVFDLESNELRVERRYKQSAMHYIKTWFAFDLVATIPVDFLVTQITPEPLGQTAVYVRVTRALRLFRLHRMFRYLKTWQELIRVPAHYMRMAKLVFLIVVFAHFDACVIFFASQLEAQPENSWVVQHDIVDASKGTQYLYSLFIALSHMLCIGYGPAGTPGTMLELLVTTVSMLVGAMFFVILVGMITSSLMTEDALDRVASSDIDIEDEITQAARRQSDMLMAKLAGRRSTDNDNKAVDADDEEKLRPVVDMLAGIMARATRTRAATVAVGATDFRMSPNKLKQVLQRRGTALQAQKALTVTTPLSNASTVSHAQSTSSIQRASAAPAPSSECE